MNSHIEARKAASAALADRLNNILEEFADAHALADGLTDMGEQSWHPGYDYDTHAEDLHEYLNAGRRQVQAALLLHRYVAETELEAQPGAEAVAL